MTIQLTHAQALQLLAVLESRAIQADCTGIETPKLDALLEIVEDELNEEIDQEAMLAAERDY